MAVADGFAGGGVGGFDGGDLRGNFHALAETSPGLSGMLMRVVSVTRTSILSARAWEKPDLLTRT